MNNINVVIVDDERLIADGFNYSFKKAYPTVNFNTFYSSQDVLNFSCNNYISILVCDINMPIIDGISLASSLKEKFPHMKILFLTGMNTFDYIYKASKLADTKYVLKIEDEKVIMKAFDSLLNEMKEDETIHNQLLSKNEEVKAITQERLKHNIIHVLNEGSYIFESDILKEKGLCILKSNNKDNSKILSLALNLLYGILPIAKGEAFLYNKTTIVFFYKVSSVNSTFAFNIEKFIEAINKEHSIKLGAIYTTSSFETIEYKNVFSKMLEFFSFTNVEDGFIYRYEDLIGKYCDDNIRIIATIKDYIWNNMDKDTSLKKISDIVYYNESYLSRHFKKLTGSNYKDFVTNLRIEKAKYLLTNSDMMIKDICHCLGFDSTSHFQFFFKKHLKTTPLEYRHNNPKKE